MVNLLKHSEAMAPLIKFSVSLSSKQIATSAQEVTKIKLMAEGGAAHVAIYDNANSIANPSDLKWAMDASTTANDTDDFVNPLHFDRGIYVVCEDGASFNPQFCLAFIP